MSHERGTKDKMYGNSRPNIFIKGEDRAFSSGKSLVY